MLRLLDCWWIVALATPSGGLRDWMEHAGMLAIGRCGFHLRAEWPYCDYTLMRNWLTLQSIAAVNFYLVFRQLCCRPSPAAFATFD
ncbi:MAG TPA: hypothetical protein VG722_05995 [Tepidisphaeraceae bacterium]|nr:hypothetical protein [Tepidisphaeraceae bacterium]